MVTRTRTVLGKSGDDILSVDLQNRLVGGAGLDNLTGSTDNNKLLGSSGDDYIDGLAGDDTIAGGSGADVLLGGLGDDHLNGGAGADYLDGGKGNDKLFGGAGDDIFNITKDQLITFNKSLDGDVGKDTLLLNIRSIDYLRAQQEIHAFNQLLTEQQQNAHVTYTFSFASLGITVSNVEFFQLNLINDNPLALEDAASMTEDDAVLSGNVLLNDSDIDVDQILIVSNAGEMQGQFGSLTLNQNGTYNYQLTANLQSLAEGQSVVEKFDYTILDGWEGRDSANLNISVIGTNDRPSAVDDITTTEEDATAAVTGNVMANDSDPDSGDFLRVNNAGFYEGKYGALHLSENGSYTYQIGANLNSLDQGDFVEDEFTYSVIDSRGEISLASLNIKIQGKAEIINNKPTFDIQGKGFIWTGIGGTDISRSVAIQSDGKIIVGGHTQTTDKDGAIHYDFALVRYNINGSLDQTFGVNGYSVLDFKGANENAFAYKIILQTDGRVLVAGGASAATDGGNDFAVARFNSDGSLDHSFGTAGKFTITDPNRSSGEVRDAVLLPDGKILLAGTVRNGSERLFSVSKLTASGEFDISFGYNGSTFANFGAGYDEANGLVLTSDGNIIVVGESGNNDFALWGLRNDGMINREFDFDGFKTESIGSGSDGAKCIMIQSDGKIIVAGYAADPSFNNYSFALVRYDPFGNRDASFGKNGVVLTEISTRPDAIYSGLIQSDGKIVVVGFSAGSMCLVRYNIDGSLDSNFGQSGIISGWSFSSVAYSIAEQADGKFVVVGQGARPGIGNQYTDFTIARFNNDGSLDKSFGSYNSMDNSIIYSFGSVPVVLDSDAQVFDAEMAAMGNGLGDYTGSKITLSRSGGADRSDLFSGVGAVNFVNGNVFIGNEDVGDFIQNDGLLSITFGSTLSSNPVTSEEINAVLQGISYSNLNPSFSGIIEIDWIFSDGWHDLQGVPGDCIATGTSSVTIIGSPPPSG